MPRRTLPGRDAALWALPDAGEKQLRAAARRQSQQPAPPEPVVLVAEAVVPPPPPPVEHVVEPLEALPVSGAGDGAPVQHEPQVAVRRDRRDRVGGIVKDVRGGESNCEQDLR